LFKNYEYEVISDNEICIWGPYEDGDTFDINVEYFSKNTECLHIELPKENNHIEIKVDDENIEGFYISPLGFQVDNKYVNKQRLGKMENIQINYSNFAHRFSLCTLKIQYLAVIQLSKSSCYAA